MYGDYSNGVLFSIGVVRRHFTKSPREKLENVSVFKFGMYNIISV